MSILQSNESLKSPLRRNARTEITRQSLISSAEKLIAEKGLANVSTRDVLAASGQRNQSALQYHFGGKDGLIQAVVSARSETLDARRLELLSEVGDSGSIKSLVAVLVRPLAELASDADGAGRQHLIFLGQAITRPGFETEQAIAVRNQEGFKAVAAKLFELVTDRDAEERQMRLDLVQDLAILSLKRWAENNCEGKTEDEMVDLLSTVGTCIMKDA